jgi:hypothetical protein
MINIKIFIFLVYMSASAPVAVARIMLNHFILLSLSNVG